MMKPAPSVRWWGGGPSGSNKQTGAAVEDTIEGIARFGWGLFFFGRGVMQCKTPWPGRSRDTTLFAFAALPQSPCNAGAALARPTASGIGGNLRGRCRDHPSRWDSLAFGRPGCAGSPPPPKRSDDGSEASTQRSVRRVNANKGAGKLRAPWGSARRQLPVCLLRLVRTPHRQVGSRRADTRGWSHCASEAGGLACIVRPHSQSRSQIVPVMIGIRVMVRSLFRISGYLDLLPKCWRVGVLDGLDGMLVMLDSMLL